MTTDVDTIAQIKARETEHHVKANTPVLPFTSPAQTYLLLHCRDPECLQLLLYHTALEFSFAPCRTCGAVQGFEKVELPIADGFARWLQLNAQLNYERLIEFNPRVDKVRISQAKI